MKIIRKRKIGQVRFEIMSDLTASISVNMNPSFIGRGFGAYVISEATRTFFKENPKVVSVQAEILEENIVSKKVFEKAGYMLQGKREKEGKEIFVYVSSAYKKY